jgi:glycosyltransferase involved in cell wall biosynthesis
MRVAVDVTIPARAVSGVGVYARSLVDALARRPIELHRWQQRLDTPGSHRFRNGCRLMIWHQVGVPRRIRSEKIDVYHSACAVGPIQDACPTVLTVHDAILRTAHAQYSPADRLYHRVFSVAAARRSAAVIVPTAHSLGEVARAYRLRDTQLHLIPHGLSERFRAPDRCEVAETVARLGLGKPYVLMVGASTPRKNGVRLLQAFVRATAPFGDESFDLAIVGPLCASVERALSADPALNRRVRRLGVVRSEDLPALYAGARCLAYPSLSEGFGLPIVEAMACGTPVLTACGGAPEEVAGGAAALASGDDVTDLASNLQRLLEDEAWRNSLIERGFARSRAFCWERTAALTEQVYRSVVR